MYEQRSPWSACALAQADLGRRCPLAKSLDTVEYIYEDTDETVRNVQDDLSLC